MHATICRLIVYSPHQSAKLAYCRDLCHTHDAATYATTPVLRAITLIDALLSRIIDGLPRVRLAA
jgi:hypothetical protein